MEIVRGEIWRADLPKPVGSGPDYPRPVIIVQSNYAIGVGLNTVIVIPLTTNKDWAGFPGNVLLEAKTGRLTADSVANVTLLTSIDVKLLVNFLGNVPERIMIQIDEGLRNILDIECPPGTLQ